MATVHLKKVGTEPCLPLWRILVFVCIYLWTRPAAGVLSDPSCSTALSLLTFHFTLHQMSTGIRDLDQAGQFSTWAPTIQSPAVQSLAWKDAIWMGACIIIKPVYTFIFQMCMLSAPQALMHPYTLREAGFWTVQWQQAWWCLSSLLWRTRSLWFLQRISIFDLPDHRTVSHETDLAAFRVHMWHLLCMIEL